MRAHTQTHAPQCFLTHSPLLPSVPILSPHILPWSLFFIFDCPDLPLPTVPALPGPLPTPSRGTPENPEIKELFPFLFKVKYCGAEIPRSNKKFATIVEGK